MFCEKCGGVVNEGAKFCASCGAKITVAEANEKTLNACKNAPSEAVMTKGRRKAKKITLIIRNSLITLLAVIMFAFSFLPIMTVGTEYLGVDVKINFSAIDNISILFSSFSNYSEITETPMYDEITELSEMVQEELGDIEDMSEKEIVRMLANEISRIAILTVKASMMLENVKAPTSYWFMAIFSWIYILLTAAFLVLSILNLLGTFGILKTGGCFDWWLTAMLAGAPVFMLLLFYTMGICYSAVSFSIFSMSGFAIAAIILSAVTVVYSIVQRMIFAKNKNVRVLVMRSVVAVLALVVMILTLAPISYSAISNKMAEIRVGSFNSYSTVSEEELESVNGVYNKEEKAEVESLYETISKMSKKELNSTSGETLNNQLIGMVVKYWYFPWTITLFSFIPVACIFVLVAAALVMWHCIKYLISGSECKIPYLIFRIVALVLTVLMLSLAITFTAMMNYAASEMAGRGYVVIIGASSILVTIFATAIMVMPTFKCRYDASEDDVEFDENNEGAVIPSLSGAIAEIKALKELYDIGAISEEEFTAKKAQLLGL